MIDYITLNERYLQQNSGDNESKVYLMLKIIKIAHPIPFQWIIRVKI